MNYHVAICQLFQPLLDHKRFSRSTHGLLKSIIVQSACDGIRLLHQHRRLFTGRYQSPFQAFCLVHLSDTLLRETRTEGQEAVPFCLETLREALPGFPFVGPLQAMFCQAVEENGYCLPSNIKELMGGQRRYGPENMLDTCERMTYTQPVDMLLDRLDPKIAENFGGAWNAFIEGSSLADGERPASAASSDRGSDGQLSPQGSPGTRALQIQALVNP